MVMMNSLGRRIGILLGLPLALAIRHGPWPMSWCRVTVTVPVRWARLRWARLGGMVGGWMRRDDPDAEVHACIR